MSTPPMANNLVYTARKLITAINSRGAHYTLSTRQFIDREGKPRNLFSIAVSTWDAERNKWIGKEVYATSSAVRITLYLRDVWYRLNGWELPMDQEKWNTIRAELEEHG